MNGKDRKVDGETEIPGCRSSQDKVVQGEVGKGVLERPVRGGDDLGP